MCQSYPRSMMRAWRAGDYIAPVVRRSNEQQLQECASSTKHALLLLAASKRAEDGNAATKDARAMPKRVVYASSMGLRSLEKTAVAKDVPNLLREVESAFDTGPPSQNVAMRVVPTMQRRVESALGMGRMCLENSVVMRDVPTGRRRVGSVQGMGQHGHSMK
mmetsp:Transcript_38087/g.65074  ORF Transcript_38087/g.65074 Transcript_38087/m.65074 type:complete len:162 (+) Transcript_38087:226-711(+)